MIVYKKADDLTNYLLSQRHKGLSSGFVPTMGALHQGHLSLINSSRNENSITVCSIFINPTQFNNSDDFKHYPVTIEKDIELLIANGCDVLFLPFSEEIYPANYRVKKYELGHLETVLEGHHRPGHFQGVCQVVDKLLEIVKPDNLYVGQKDYQQCKVIEKLLELKGRRDTIKLNIAPTVREENGLAMSSRNLRLSTEQRKQAHGIFEALQFVKTNLAQKPIAQLRDEALKCLENKEFKVDYFEIVNANTLVSSIDKTHPLIALVAASIGTIRLIDNLPLNPEMFN